MKTRIRSLLALFCALTLLLCAVPAFAEDAEAPDITHFNLAFDNEIHLLYRIDFSAIPNFTPTKNNCGVLFWKEEPTGATIGTEDKLLPPQTAKIDGADAYVVKYTDLNATQMCDTVWARAFAIVDGEYRYSELVDYSIVQYAKTMLGYEPGVSASNDGQLRQMLCDMIQYGESAQKYFGYNLEHFPTDILPKNQLNVCFITNGYGEIPSQTVYRGRRATEPTLPEREGYEFLGWYNGADKWDFDQDRVNDDLNLTARWNRTGEYSELQYVSNGDGTCYVEYGGKCPDADIRIPPMSPDGDRVIAIWDKAFCGMQDIISVTIPETVLTVGGGAFADCRNLKTVTFAGGTTMISGIAFSNCPALQTVTLPNTLQIIEYGAFSGCTNLSEITLPESLTQIGSRTFENCQNLVAVIIPANVQHMGEEMFSGCSLQSITLPFIGFDEGANDSATLGTLLGYQEQLYTVRITGGTIIPENAFEYCSNVHEIFLPESITTISNNAFNMVSYLNSIKLPASLTFIGDNAFSSCYSLYNYEFAGTVEQWNQIQKGVNWCPYFNGIYYVTCTDGTVIISG